MILQRLRSMLGPHVALESDPTGIPRVAPRSDQECALVLRTAASEGWRVRIEGSGNWIPPDAPADVAVTTRALTRITYLDPGDMVASVEAGIGLEALRTALADKGAWVAIDAPGSGRSVGSLVATGTAGPLRNGFGPVRDHIVGLTLVSADGRVIRAGGKVVKNVAGFDIAKLAAGSFGGFGLIVSVNLRLRAVPRADITLTAIGSRDRLLQASRAILETGTIPAALDVVSPAVAGASDWALAVRLLGSEVQVEAERKTVAAAVAPLSLTPLAAADGGTFWRTALASVTAHPITIRLGTLPGALDEALDTVSHHLDDEWLMVNVRAGVVRWSGAARIDHLTLLRYAAAQREMPVTLERAPWNVRTAVGHFGAYREGAGRLVASLRATFDPAQVLVVPLDAHE